MSSCTICPSDDGLYISMQVQGNISRQLALEWNLEAHALGRQLGINRYLLDLTQSRNLEPNAEGYKFVNTDLARAEKVIDRSARVAVVVSPGDNSHNFIEVVARNAGLDVTLFNSMRLALMHLHTQN